MKVTSEQVDGNIEKLIKRFLKKTKKLRIVEDCLDRRYYIKPSAKRNTERRLKQRAAEKEKAAAPKDD